MKRVVSIFACAGFFVSAGAQVSLQNASGALESAYAEWTSDGSDSYNVYYSGAGASASRAHRMSKSGTSAS